MPTKVRRLKKEAIQACTIRKHNMKRFTCTVPGGHYSRPRFFTSFCRDCNMYVQVIPKPYPNEIDIGGTAVALNCKGKVK